MPPLPYRPAVSGEYPHLRAPGWTLRITRFPWWLVPNPYTALPLYHRCSRRRRFGKEQKENYSYGGPLCLPRWRKEVALPVSTAFSLAGRGRERSNQGTGRACPWRAALYSPAPQADRHVLAYGDDRSRKEASRGAFPSRAVKPAGVSWQGRTPLHGASTTRAGATRPRKTATLTAPPPPFATRQKCRRRAALHFSQKGFL